ncbi:hypothetical protein JHW43_007706 [Diplocarpon mali]|nr:hypothetical protein JHW43_007706 [Diplocarpon mali]
MKLPMLLILAHAFAGIEAFTAKYYCDYGMGFSNGETCAEGKHSFCCIGEERGWNDSFPVGRTCQPGIGTDKKDKFPLCTRNDIYGNIKCVGNLLLEPIEGFRLTFYSAEHVHDIVGVWE